MKTSVNFLLVLAFAVQLTVGQQVDLDSLRDYLLQQRALQNARRGYEYAKPAAPKWDSQYVPQQQAFEGAPYLNEPPVYENQQPPANVYQPNPYNNLNAQKQQRTWDMEARGWLKDQEAQPQQPQNAIVNWGEPVIVAEPVDAPAQPLPQQQERAWVGDQMAAVDQAYQFDAPPAGRNFDDQQERVGFDVRAVEELDAADNDVDADDIELDDAEVSGVSYDDDDKEVPAIHLQALQARRNGTQWANLYLSKVALAEKYEKSKGKKGKVYGVIATLGDDRRYFLRNFPVRKFGGKSKQGRERVFRLLKPLSQLWKKTDEKKIVKSTLKDFAKACKAGRSSFESAELMMKLD